MATLVHWLVSCSFRSMLDDALDTDAIFNKMDIKQEDVFELKHEELMIKDEYISDPDPGSTSTLTFSATTTEDFIDMQSESQDCSYQSETKLTITNKKLCHCCFNTSDECSLKMNCDFKTARQDHLKRHMLTHSDEKSFQCEQCDFKTSDKVTLQQHILILSGENRHHCEQRNYKTVRKGHLKQHLFTPSGEKPYHCERCDFKTSEKGYLKVHLLTHSGEKPHHCKQCDFKTALKHSLKRHMLTHSHEKPHHCEQCDFKTSVKGTLKRHMLMHSGEKPHHCEQCDFKTAHKHNLNQHVLTHSNHTVATHSLLKKICSTDGFNEDTKHRKKFILDLKIVPNEYGV